MNSEPTAVQFKDRKAGLVIFGLLTVMMGVVCALVVPLAIFAQTVSAKPTGAPPNYHVIIPAIVTYGGLAVTLIWLGIGSIKARRWARALLLILSWSWLIVGVLSFVVVAFMAPQFLQAIEAAQRPGQPELSPAAKSIILLIPALMLLVIFLVLPLIWLLFYQSKHVRATCEARDPVVRWTDRCPLPVLAVSLWLAFGALAMLMMPLAYHGVFPLFGMFAFGALGTALYLALAVVWAYSAYALYKLDRRGWWLIVAALCFFSASCVITYSRHDPMELYRLMGYAEEQIAQIHRFSFFKRETMAWASLLYTLPFLGYLLYIRKFFRHVDTENLT